MLEPWRGWVLEKHREVQCPPRYDNGAIRACAWLSTLDVDLTHRGGRFTADVEAFAETDVLLPGGGDQWPNDVRSSSGPAIVTRLDDRPRVRLAPGRTTLTGAFVWKDLPDSIPLPRQHGLLALRVDGAVIAQPLIDGDKLWLGKGPGTGDAVPNDALTVRVYRALNDGVPMRLDTFVDLSVAGSHRVVTLPGALPEAFVATGMDSDVPARLEQSGDLKVQVEPGEWKVRLYSRALGAPTVFRATPANPPWPAEEIWGFGADRALRSVSVEGATPIDLSQTDAPFKDLPAFVVTATSELRLIEQFRGDPNPAPNEFALARSVWLSFDGATYTVVDTLDGNVAKPTRLSARFTPGRVTVDEAPQLITELSDAQPGIELPSGIHRIVATSELARPQLATAVGWETDVARLSGDLHLPPGWRLLWTHGVDRAPTAWLASWTLWDIFLVVITTVLALRLLGRAAAALTAITLIVVYQEPGAPTITWIVLLLLLGVLRIAHARFAQFARLGYVVVLAGTVIAVLGFAIDSFRMALYPQLENQYGVAYAPSQTTSAPMLDQVALGGRDDLPREAFEGKSNVASMPASAPPTSPRAPQAPRKYEANTQVQTGPGVPTWRWRDEALIWDGPVTTTQPIALVLSPPWLTRGLHVVGPVLLLLLAGVLVAATLPPSNTLPPWFARIARATPGGLLVAVIGAAAAPDARADIPSAQMLAELERRLTAPPECLPACAAIDHANVRLTADTLTVVLKINAATDVALPLPSTSPEWWPAEVRNGDGAGVVGRDNDGQLAIAVMRGQHRVELTGSVAQLDRFELPFPMRVGGVTLDLDGWRAYGTQDGNLRGASLQFERAAPASAGRAPASLASDPITPYFTVSRVIEFGLQWRMHTEVMRVAPRGGSIPFAVPLVPGEALQDGRVRVENDRVTGVLAPDQQSLGWDSTLPTTPTLQLVAPPIVQWSEQWTLIPSNFWHVDYGGLAPLKLASGTAAGPRFAPLAGEILDVRISRPTPVPGETITVERVDLTEAPGARARRSTLALSLLSSQGGNYAVRIPDDAKVLGITINGAPQPIPARGAELPLPVVPGRQAAEIVWEAPHAIDLTTRTSAVELPGNAYNVGLHVTLPTDRWPLFVGGPRLGPAVLYWGVMLVVVGVAVLLARVPGLPLTTLDGVLLGFGMSLCNLPSTVLVAAWLLILLARQRWTDRLKDTSDSGFKIIQVVIALTSIVSLSALVASVPQGLLGTPEMQIVGNNSSAFDYHWFQDRSQHALPTAFIVSLPIWVYRIAMLAWSLWLAFAIVRWVRWAWTAYSSGGIWNRPRAGDDLAVTPS